MSADPKKNGARRVTRNHTVRVEELTELHEQGILRYVQAARDPRGVRVYEIEVGDELHRVPAKNIDAWLEASRAFMSMRQGGGNGNGADGQNAPVTGIPTQHQP